MLNNLKNLSNKISLISIGYSFADDFGKELLEKFDSFNYRDRKWIINVDPFPNENALAYYTKNRVCIVKTSFQDFFKRYRAWEIANHEILIKKRGLGFSNSKESKLSMPQKLLIDLDGVVKQLNTRTKDRFIKDADYYKGEEPNFDLITRGVDVIKTKYIKEFRLQILKTLENGTSTFLPIFFIVGDFGIGKSTFTLRLIYELEKIEELDLVAFEIINFNRVRKEFIIELIKHCTSKNIIFYCDEVEVESYFKALLEIQRELSIEQFHDFNVFFIVPIRENILEKHKLNRTIPKAIQLKISGHLESEEIDDLLEKLKKSALITFRDVAERNEIKNRIQSLYGSDSFVALMQIITSGKHEADLISAYTELSKDAQSAFLYTALLHKHKLLMPASWLRQNTSMDWDEFTEKVIKAEGKGLLIQEDIRSTGTQPDLYFRTKHPLIAAKLGWTGFFLGFFIPIEIPELVLLYYGVISPIFIILVVL